MPAVEAPEPSEPAISPLARALVRAEPRAPEAILEFDRIAGAAPGPDLHEHSLRFGAASDAFRLTYYFDVQAERERRTDALARFSEIARALTVAIPPAMAQALEASAYSAAALQIVVGIEVSERATTCRFYVVLKDAAPDAVAGVLEAAGLEAPETADVSRVYILGVELGAGEPEVKLYFRLDAARLRRSVRNLAELGELATRARYVVLQQCVRHRERRRLYFHADSADVVGRWLEQRARGAASVEDLVKRARRLDELCPVGRLEPWIVALPYLDGRADPSEGTVYLHHFADSRVRRRLPLAEARLPATSRAPLEPQEPGDLLHDYTLVPYEPVTSTTGKIRSVNVLIESMARAGVESEGARVVELLRSGLGPFRTVWGIKWQLPDPPERWELYFYDPERTHADLSIPRVRNVLAPALDVDATPPADLPWHMFSVEFDARALQQRARVPVDVYVSTNPKVKGSDRSYKVSGTELSFENVYTFHQPDTEIDEILYRLRHGVHYAPDRHNLARLIPPELLDCEHICVANKRRTDAIYFSGLTHAQMVHGLDFFGVRGGLVEYLSEGAVLLDHLRWDIGVDFVGARDDLAFTKVGLYGSF